MALNGRFPDSLLAYLGWPEADHLRLRPDAAASITRLAAAFEAHFGKPLYLSDAYRTYTVQVTLKVIKGKFAATPGTSNHGWGIAIDAASRVNVDGSAEHRWMEANAPAYGWFNPIWAQDYNSNNGEHEPWHWEYSAARDTHPTPAQEDDMPLNAGDATLINSVVINVLRSKEASEIIRDAVLTAVLDEGVGTVAQAVRDARVIARRTEVAVLALPAPGTPGVAAAIDYAALAKAVNDDAARRLAS